MAAVELRAKSCLFNQLYEFRPAQTMDYRYSSVYTGARIFNVYSGTRNIPQFKSLQQAINAGLYPEEALKSNPISKNQMMKIIYGFQGFNVSFDFSMSSYYTNISDVAFGMRGNGRFSTSNPQFISSNNFQKRISGLGGYSLSSIKTSFASVNSERGFASNNSILYDNGYTLNASKFSSLTFLNKRMVHTDPITFSLIPPNSHLVSPYGYGAILECGEFNNGNVASSSMQEVSATIFRDSVVDGFNTGRATLICNLSTYFLEIDDAYYCVMYINYYISDWLLNPEISSPPLVQTDGILNVLFTDDYGIEQINIEGLEIGRAHV